MVRKSATVTVSVTPAAWLGTRRAKDRLVKFLHASEPVADWLRANVGESSA